MKEFQSVVTSSIKRRANLARAQGKEAGSVREGGNPRKVTRERKKMSLVLGEDSPLKSGGGEAKVGGTGRDCAAREREKIDAEYDTPHIGNGILKPGYPGKVRCFQQRKALVGECG